MALEFGLYEGRREQRRMRAIDKQIERLRSEFDNLYANSPEMRYLEEEIRWEDTSRVIFLLALRDTNFKWHGLQDYGFIRMCAQWIRTHELQAVRAEDAVAMLKEILPSQMCIALGDELAALELS